MILRKLAVILAGIGVGAVAGAAFQLSSANAATGSRSQPATVRAASAVVPTASASASPGCPQMSLALAFTTNVKDASALHLRLPWGQPGGAEGQMIEDYGAYNGTSVRKHLPVHDVTTGHLVELVGHNAIDIKLDSGTPLFAVTSGTSYRITNWTVPGFPTGWAVVLVSDVLTDDQGQPIAFLYGHVREFEVANGRHVDAGALIARSGGDPDDPGAGFSDMANVHFEVIESDKPLLAHAGTVNPHWFLENLYAYAAQAPAGCF
jgi:murein DD-endopeptidase MepM/ murein hydrolase activator NlpD